MENSDLLGLFTTPVTGFCAVPEEHSSSLLSSPHDSSSSSEGSSSSISSDDELLFLITEAKAINARLEQKTLEAELRSRSSIGSRHSTGHDNSVAGASVSRRRKSFPVKVSSGGPNRTSSGSIALPSGSIASPSGSIASPPGSITSPVSGSITSPLGSIASSVSSHRSIEVIRAGNCCGTSLDIVAETPSSDHSLVYELVDSSPRQEPATYRGSESELLQVTTPNTPSTGSSSDPSQFPPVQTTAAFLDSPSPSLSAVGIRIGPPLATAGQGPSSGPSHTSILPFMDNFDFDAWWDAALSPEYYYIGDDIQELYQADWCSAKSDVPTDDQKEADSSVASTTASLEAQLSSAFQMLKVLQKVLLEQIQRQQYQDDQHKALAHQVQQQQTQIQ